MKKCYLLTYLLILLYSTFLISCEQEHKSGSKHSNIRPMADTIGFAHLSWQMDSITERIVRYQGDKLRNIFKRIPANTEEPWKVVISPHDDYSYVGYLYPATLSYLKAKTIIIFGVSHKARRFGLENVLVFDSFDKWESAYGLVNVSSYRDKIMKELPEGTFIVHDSMQIVEHSVEALLPFIKQHNKGAELISILVPYMSFNTMDKLSEDLAEAISVIINKNNLEWGKDLAFAISSDAVHYGDEDWGGMNYAIYGADSNGYVEAVTHDLEIIDNCFLGALTPEKIKRFTQYILDDNDYKSYKWTWCGRYSIPLGLLTAYKLNELISKDNNEMQPIVGYEVGYATSIDHERIFVEDLQMGVTAPANLRHWVGYAGIGFK